MSDHYDWIVIGSGFGGSVSALRLSEKGYRVCVLEKGKRFA
ncbi:MAG: GMC family oxidoreductase, partial [Myxococcales bacterium]|nr:GMC family oxidoreductase [Myxococcales bacterium]